MEGLKLVLGEHKNNISNIFSMAFKDLRKQYSGTLLSYTWAVIRNLIYIFAYWFTISIGLKGSAKVGYPYMAWLVAGLTGWFFIKETLFPAAVSIRKNKYLVTKMIYPVSTIPTFKVISSLISNCMFMPVVIFILIVNGISVDIHWLQVFYYQFAAVMLMIGISWSTSALVVISRDIEILINSTVFLLFWFSPVLYPASNLKGTMAIVMKFNPFYYLIEGFRATFLYQEWFWERPVLTGYFWCFVVISMIVGSFVHSRLRNQFVDVL